MNIQVKKLHKDAVIPQYQHRADAGFDLFTVEDISISPGSTAILPTGLAFAIPDGYEMQIRMRSGSSLKTPLIVPNAPGTIDAGYRGEVGIIVRNVGPKEYTVKKGERIAQAVLNKVEQATFELTENLPDTTRGSGGFGSTGAN